MTNLFRDFTYNANVSQQTFHSVQKGAFMIKDIFIINESTAVCLGRIGINPTNVMLNLTQASIPGLNDTEKTIIPQCFGRTDNKACVYDIESKKIEVFHHPNPKYRRGPITVYTECMEVFDYKCVYFMYDHRTG